MLHGRMIKNIFFLLIGLQVTAQDSIHTLDSLPDLPVIGEFIQDQNEESPEQEIAPLLQASRDGLLQAASFIWSNAGFKYRGQMQNNLFLNESPLRDYLTDGSVWRWWSGLNDMIRFSETKHGITANRHGVSTNNGYTNIESMPMLSKPSTRYNLSGGNRTDLVKVGFTSHSGLIRSRWAWSFSTVWRMNKNLNRHHTYANSGGYWLAMEYSTTKHHFTLHTFAAPYYKEGATSETEEVFHLAGPRYNSKVGIQNNSLRNIAVSKGFQPVLILSHHYTSKNGQSWRNSLQGIFGKTKYQGLNYSDALNPSPVYYQYLPMYLSQIGDTAQATTVLANWQQQAPLLDIDRMIRLNQMNLYSIDPNQLNTQETRARFILENRVDQLTQFQWNTLLNKRIKRWFHSIGTTTAFQSNRRYKELADLLGASFWLDYDTIIKSSNDSVKQNNLNAMNQPIKVNDRFGYDYSLNVLSSTLWQQLEYTGKHLDYFIGTHLVYRLYWREGFMRNGKFPAISQGQSIRIQYINPASKGGVIFKINGRHFITTSMAWSKNAPTPVTCFPSPSTRNTVLNLKSDTRLQLETAYEWRIPGLRGRITLYSAEWQNTYNLLSFWHDEYNAMVNQLTYHPKIVSKGLEGFLERSISGTHLLSCAWYVSENIYKGNGQLTGWQDNVDSLLYYQTTTYLNNYYVGNGPQAAVSLSYRYSAKKYWNINFVSGVTWRNYETINPLKHTQQATAKFLDAETHLVHAYLDQAVLPLHLITGLNAGWSKRFKRKYTLGVMLSMNNLLNKRVVTRSTEALRYDAAWPERFSNKIVYNNGRQINMSITWSY